MTGLELLQEGIKNNDMQLIQQAQAMLANQTTTVPNIAIKPTKRKYTKKKVVEKQTKRTKDTGKAQKTNKKALKVKDDAEYLALINKIEEERYKSIIKGEITGYGKNQDIDTSNLMEGDLLVKGKDGKMHKEYNLIKRKKVSARRPSFESVEIRCSRCGNPQSIPQSMYGSYCSNPNEQNSDKPLFVCDRCHS